jgi:hypothetical protein
VKKIAAWKRYKAKENNERMDRERKGKMVQETLAGEVEREETNNERQDD